MKKSLEIIGNVLYFATVVWDIIEFLALPALFVIIGIISSLPWQFYVISIGIYIAVFVVAELVLRLFFYVLGKKYTPFVERKIEKYFGNATDRERL